jgi:hypothetical protein
MAVMEPDANLVEQGEALVAVVDEVLADWVVRGVVALVRAYTGADPDDDVLAQARAAGEQARVEVVEELRALVRADVDDQRANPLAVIRRAVRFPTAVLRAAGVPPVVRDEFAERAFPDDVYGLSPAAFADVDPRLHDPGIVWGAAKAHAHLSRRQHPHP